MGLGACRRAGGKSPESEVGGPFCRLLATRHSTSLAGRGPYFRQWLHCPVSQRIKGEMAGEGLDLADVQAWLGADPGGGEDLEVSRRLDSPPCMSSWSPHQLSRPREG